MKLDNVHIHVQWNLFIIDTLGPTISGLFLLLYRGFLYRVLKSESPLREVPLYV